MEHNGSLDFLPLWGLFFATLALVLLSIEGGYRLGAYRHRRSELEKEAPVSGMVAATLGLLAFLLAFTFGLAATRFDTRKEVLLEEANAIGTAYLRAGMLPEGGDEVRGLLREYVRIRLESAQSGQVGAGLRQSEKLQEQLWAHASALGVKNPNSIVAGLFIQALNDVIDVHSKRVVSELQSRIPGAIWVGLYSLAVLALGAMGYHAGVSGTSRSLAVVAVAVAFSAVMWLIADLDRPHEGSLMLNQQPMIELLNSMAAPKP